MERENCNRDQSPRPETLSTWVLRKIIKIGQRNPHSNPKYIFQIYPIYSISIQIKKRNKNIFDQEVIDIFSP